MSKFCIIVIKKFHMTCLVWNLLELLELDTAIEIYSRIEVRLFLKNILINNYTFIEDSPSPTNYEMKSAF